MRAMLILMVVIMFSGCAQLLEFQDKSADRIAKAISEYCENTDTGFREKFRESINEKAAPNAIEVTCAE